MLEKSLLKTSQVQPEVKATIKVPRHIWANIRKLSTLTNVTSADLVIIAIKILLAIIKSGKIPDDLGEVLAKFDPQALESLSNIIKRLA